jgi:hypothetical protein
VLPTRSKAAPPENRKTWVTLWNPRLASKERTRIWGTGLRVAHNEKAPLSQVRPEIKILHFYFAEV